MGINGQTYELYDHRQTIFVALMNCSPEKSWKSLLHDDGTMFDGDWFIAGINTEMGQATYHLEGRFWERARVQELTRAPKWDGHTSADVLKRIANEF